MNKGRGKKINRFKTVRRLACSDAGAVTMEYVLLCVMIAAASMMMVICFSRAVARQFAMVSYAMAGHPSELLEETRDRFKQDAKDDAVVANVYSDRLHGEATTER